MFQVVRLFAILLIGAALPALDAPSFSHTRGYHDAGFTLQLQARAGTVWYTTDGSLPVAESSAGGEARVSIPITGTTVVRALSTSAGEQSAIVAHTYLFPGDILQQPSQAMGTPAPPSNGNRTWGSTHMDESVVGERGAAQAREDLLALPVLSIALPQEHFFGDSVGLYPNSSAARLDNEALPDPLGSAWERRCSVEIFDASGTIATAGAGLRPAGNASRDVTKKSLALEFRRRYGDSVLRGRVFPDSMSERFDELRLRAPWMDTTTIMTMAFSDQLQRLVGGHHQASRFMHVYINGIYWGIYDVSERADGGFAEDHFGGDKDDWETHRVKGSSEQDLDDAWTWFANITADDDEGFRRLAEAVDLEQYVDYFLLAGFLLHADTVEDRAIANPDAGRPWRFFLWDTETFLWPRQQVVDGSLRYLPRALQLFLPPDPTGLVFTPEFLRLSDHAEGRQLIADRIERAFGPGGALTTPILQAAWQDLADHLEGPFHLEWARWKGRFSRAASPASWAQATTDLHDHWLVEHSDRTLGYYQAAGFHDDRAPGVLPQSRSFSGTVNVTVTPTESAGTCYLRQDGLDPRMTGGRLRPGSQMITTSTTITIDESSLVSVRMWDGTQWSPLVERRYTRDDQSARLVISELHYHPAHSQADLQAGLLGRYYQGASDETFDDTAEAVRERIDATLAIDLAAGPPVNGLDPAAVGIRWTGYLVPLVDGTHRIGLERNGQVRLWLENGLESEQPAIDAWTSGSDPQWIQRDLIAGKRYRVRIHFASDTADGSVALRWQPPGGSEETIPRSALVAFDETADDVEFCELHNRGGHPLDLSGWTFRSGIRHRFAPGTILAPDERLVLVSNPRAFARRYPGVAIGGVYAGHCSDDGETIALHDAQDRLQLSLTYNDGGAWPAAADGAGPSLVFLGGDANDPAAWAASDTAGGRPGDPGIPADAGGVIINEALTHTDLPQVDAIELFNPTDTEIAIGGWYLSDDRQTPQRWTIPAGIRIPAGGYHTFDEADFGTDFRLSSMGEQVYLFATDSASQLSGYSHGFSFGAAATEVSFGRHVISTGAEHFVAQKRPTLGAANSGPLVGPLVISELRYHPPAGAMEYIEIANISDQPIALFDAEHGNPWRLDGAAYTFPADTTIAAGGVLLLVGGDPATFRSTHGIDPGTQVLGPFPGRLDNSGETIALQRPDTPELVDGETVVPMITVDAVDYDISDPWPSDLNTTEQVLERIALGAYGDDPANWRSASPTPGSISSPVRRITIVEPDESVEATIDGSDTFTLPASFDTTPHLDQVIRFIFRGGNG